MKRYAHGTGILAGLCGLALCLATAPLRGEVADGGLVYSNDPAFTTGAWNSNYTAIKAKADADNVPLVVFWANPGCAYCKKLETALNTSAAYAWQKERGYYFVFGYGTSGEHGKAKTFARHASGYFPYVAVYWRQGLRGTSTQKKNFAGRAGMMTVTSGDLADQFMGTVDYWVGDYQAPTTYVGGTFAGEEETAGNRLEAEAGTKTVAFTLVRDAAAAQTATNHLLTVTGPDGQAATNKVSWRAGQAEQTLTLDLTDFPSFDAPGETLALAVLEEGGEVQDARTVTFVDRENAADNPLWIGEQTADTLAFGEWTMDLDAAKEKAAKAEGAAYTLVSVGGSLWCPDCANAERNFLGVTDEQGENRFRAWAEANQVALVSLDIPNFTSQDGAFASPTLLSRTAFKTTLARAREYPVSGADPALTNAMLRSGLGYLTRKGVTDEAAAEALARIRALVAKGGPLHGAADANDNRTGVPIFVLLRKDGTAAARLTRFAAESPMAAAREQWGDIIKRFDEMLAIAAPEGAHADPAEGPANDGPGAGAVPFRANGGMAAGELSHADFRDVFRLEGVGGNAIQKVTVTGTTGARVTASFLALEADGKKVAVGTPASGALTAEGFALEHEFTEAGEYYLELAGEDITNASFAVESSVALNFHPYALAGTVVLVPQTARATASAPEGSDQVTMRLVKGQTYRIAGLKAEADGEALAPVDPDAEEGVLFTALVDGDASLTCASAGGEVTYSVWTPGRVGFAAAARTVQENVGEVEVAVARTGGAAGEVVLRVSLDMEATTLYDSDGTPRFAFDGAELVWKEGEEGVKTVTVKVIDDTRFDGTGVVALALEQTGGDGTPEIVGAAFALTVTDNDKQSAGKAAFTGAKPYFARSKTVYVREGEAAAVTVGRVEASDGPVTVLVKASSAALTLGGDVEEAGTLAWGNHDAAEKTVTVEGLAAGKTATLTLANATDGLKILSTSNYVKVVAVAADAPSFVEDAAQTALTRYVASSNLYAVGSVPDGTTKLTFARISGTLPAGLRAAWDPEAQALAVSGAPTAKAGVYTAVYQVSARVGTKTVPGLTVAIAFTVTDVAAAGADGTPALNPALAATRTFYSLPALENDDATEGTPRLVGTLQVTVPATGRVSAKLLCAAGTVSFASRNWAEAEENGTMRAELVGSRAGYAMTLEAAPDGALAIALTIEEDGETATATVETDGRRWSKEDSAEAWRGQYTVALRNMEQDETVEGLAPRGHGYLTLKMASSTAWNAGRMTWAGVLPNGTSVSGSATLARGLKGPEDCWAYLPVYLRSSRDVLSVLMQIAQGAVEHDEPTSACQAVFEAGDFAQAYWFHADSAALAYTAELDVYGGNYQPTYDFGAYFEEFYAEGAVAPNLAFDVDALAGTLAVGTPGAVDAVGVAVGSQSLAIAKDAANACRATLSFNRSTGVVTGTFRLPVVKANGAATVVTATYRGVMLIGWGPGCGCDEALVESDVKLPFVNGAFWVSDTQVDPLTLRKYTVRRGGAAEIAAPAAAAGGGGEESNANGL